MRWVGLVFLAACHRAAPAAEHPPEVSTPVVVAPPDAAPAPVAISIDAGDVDDDFDDFTCTRTTDSGFDGDFGGGLTGDDAPVNPPGVRFRVVAATGPLDANDVGCHLELYLDTVADCTGGDVSITFVIKEDGSVTRLSAGGGDKTLQSCALKLLERMRGDFGFPMTDGETEAKIALRFY